MISRDGDFIEAVGDAFGVADVAAVSRSLRLMLIRYAPSIAISSTRTPQMTNTNSMFEEAASSEDAFM